MGPGSRFVTATSSENSSSCDPAPASDVLVAEVADVRDGPAERRQLRGGARRRRPPERRLEPSVACRAGLPERLVGSRDAAFAARDEDEEEVGEPVQVHARRAALSSCSPRRRERLALRAAADRPRDVERGGRTGVPPGSTKLRSSGSSALRRSQSSSSRSTSGCSTRSRPSTSAGTERSAPRSKSSFWTRSRTRADRAGHVAPASTTPERRVELVDGAVRLDARVELRDARPVAERRLPRVAAARVDPRQANRLVLRARHARKRTRRPRLGRDGESSLTPRRRQRDARASAGGHGR